MSLHRFLVGAAVLALRCREIRGQSPSMPNLTASPVTLAPTTALPTPAPTIFPSPTLADVVASNGNLTTLAALANATDLLQDLSADFIGTLFAPDNAAFASFDDALNSSGRPNYLDMLQKDEWLPHGLCFLLSHASVERSIFAADLVDGLTLPNAWDGTNLTISLNPPRVDNNTIISADLNATNGVAHIIDFPIVPDCVGVSILAALQGDPRFSILVELVQLAGLVDAISGAGPLAVFAPTDDAFLALGNTALDFLRDPANVDALQIILAYHILPSAFIISETVFLYTLEGSVIVAVLTEEISQVSDFQIAANLTELNSLYSNGYLHAIDAVFTPPTVAEFLAFNVNEFNVFKAMAVAVGVDDFIVNATNYSVFLFPDAAYLFGVPRALQSNLGNNRFGGHIFEVLANHLLRPQLRASDIFDGNRTELDVLSFSSPLAVDQGNKTIQNAAVTFPDLTFTNGIAHVMNFLLLPDSMVLGTVDFGRSLPDYSILVELIDLSRLTNVLNSFAGITLFAPVNAAWDAGLVDFLKHPNNIRTLQLVILNHVLAANLYTLVDGLVVDSTAVQTLFFYNSGNTFLINNAALADVDPVFTMNGLAYPMNQVIMPQTIADHIMHMEDYNIGINTSIVKDAFVMSNFFDNLDTESSITVFAPNNTAFGLAPPHTSKFFGSAWLPHLQNLVRNHVAGSLLNQTTLLELTELTMVGGATFNITSSAGTPVIEDSEVILGNIFGANGHVHIVNRVLLPSVLALSLYQQIEAQEDLSTLKELIDYAGLSATLSNLDGGPLTVLCPTNEAFNASNLTIASLSPSQAADVVLYHAIGRNLLTSDFLNGDFVSSLSGNQGLSVTVSDGNVTINGNARVDTARSNMLAANGVFHLVSAVLMLPPATPMPTNPPSIARTPSPSAKPTTGSQPPPTSAAFSSRPLVKIIVFVTCLLNCIV